MATIAQERIEQIFLASFLLNMNIYVIFKLLSL